MTSRRAQTLPFTGRERELEALRAMLQAKGEQTGAFVLIGGERGVGKTRLVEEFTAEASSRGWAVALGQARELDSGRPYAVVADAVEPLLRDVDSETLAACSRGLGAQLSLVFPSVQCASSSRIATAIDADGRSSLFWSVSQFLQRLARHRPLILALEDSQWADSATLALLHFVCGQVRAAKLVVLVTGAEDQQEGATSFEGFVTSCDKMPAGHRFSLLPLTAQELLALLERHFPSAAPGRALFAERLHDQTRGNSFFIEKILESLVERGELRLSSGRWEGWDADVTALPRTLQDAIGARLRALSPHALRIAGVAAAAGTSLHHRLLRRIGGLEREAYVEAVDELLRRRILVATAHDDDVLDFAHPVVRSVLYRSLSAARAQLYHARVLAGLEGQHGADAVDHAAELAPHLAHVPEYPVDRRLTLLIAAGRRALAVYAYADAERYLVNARDHSAGLTESARRDSLLEILPLLAHARQRTGSFDAAADLLGQARDLARSAGDVASEARLERQRGLLAFDAGELGAAIARHEACEALAIAQGDRTLAIRARLARATALQSSGQLALARQLVADVLPKAESLGDAATMARAHGAMVLLYSWSGPVSEARRHGAIALEYAEASGEREVGWSAHWTLAVMAGFAGDVGGVREHQAAAARIAEELRSPLLAAMSAEVGIEHASVVGQWDEGLAEADRVLPVARALAPRTLLPRLLVWTGIMRLGRGEHTVACELFDEAWTIATTGYPAGTEPDLHVVIPACIGKAAYHLAHHEFTTALEYAERGLALADRFGVVAWAIHRLLPLICEALLWLKAFDRAQELADRLERESGAFGHPIGLASASAVNALLRRVRDSDDGAHEQLLTAAELMEAIPFPYNAARLMTNSAQLLVAAGKIEDAERVLRRAHEIVHRMGAGHELRVVRRELQAIGVRPRGRLERSTSLFTAREREIAVRVAARKANKEIAVELGVSEKRVRNRLTGIYAKAGVRSRGELGDWVRGGGLDGG